MKLHSNKFKCALDLTSRLFAKLVVFYPNEANDYPSNPEHSFIINEDIYRLALKVAPYASDGDPLPKSLEHYVDQIIEITEFLNRLESGKHDFHVLMGVLCNAELANKLAKFYGQKPQAL
jgi:hypothetical protein